MGKDNQKPMPESERKEGEMFVIEKNKRTLCIGVWGVEVTQ